MIFMTDTQGAELLADLEKQAERLDNQAEMAYQEWLNAKDEAVGTYLKQKQLVRQGQAEMLRDISKQIGLFLYLHMPKKER